MKRILPLAALLLALASSAGAQEMRMFLDIPSFYAHSYKVNDIQSNSGLGMDAGFGIGTHNFMAKLSGGTTVTADFVADAIEETVSYNPFVRLEAGAGMWRSNGNKCAKHNSNAFSTMAKGGMMYAFQAEEMQFTVGAELSYFRIRDFRRNTELFVDGGLNLTTEQIYANLGLRFFLNLRSY